MIIELIVLCIVMYFLKGYVAVKFDAYFLELGIVLVFLVLALAVLLCGDRKKLTNILMFIAIVVWFTFYSVLIKRYTNGMPIMTVINANKAFINTVEMDIARMVGKAILFVLTPFGYLLDLVALPMFGVFPVIMFVQKVFGNMLCGFFNIKVPMYMKRFGLRVKGK